jgi:hypothetical protein
MPGHRRDDEPADATRVQTAVPATGPGSEVYGNRTGGAHEADPVAADRPAAATDSPTTVHAAAPPPAPDGGEPVSDRGRSTGQDESAAAPTRTQVVAAQRARYGGVSWGSAFFGWLSANGIAVLLIAILSAAGVAFGLTQGLGTADQATTNAGAIGIGGGIALLVLLFLAYLAGGYVAGRMARFDGAKQGVAVWVIGLIVVLLLALAGLVFGAQYNVLSRLNLPRIPIDEGTATTAGIIALVAVLLVTLLASVLGGLLGARYHRKVDRVGFTA